MFHPTLGQYCIEEASTTSHGGLRACVCGVSYSTMQFKMCHFLKPTVFNWESTWIDSTLLALLAHRSCKAEWQTRSLPHVKKCVVLFQYSFWSLIYLLHLKKNYWQICWFRTSANTSALRLTKERHVWKVSYILKKKAKSEVRYNIRVFFLAILSENYPPSFNSSCCFE